MNNVIYERVGGGPRRFSEFLAAHDINLLVIERSLALMAEASAPQWYATTRFELKGNGVLIGAAGNGDTPEAAVEDYKHRIRGQILVNDARNGGRIEIQCPNEWLPEELAR